MKEKRYEIYKRGELIDCDPPGVNALAGDAQDLLSERTRGESPMPRSTLNSGMYIQLMNKRAPDRKPPSDAPKNGRNNAKGLSN